MITNPSSTTSSNHQLTSTGGGALAVVVKVEGVGGEAPHGLSTSPHSPRTLSSSRRGNSQASSFVDSSSSSSSAIDKSREEVKPNHCSTIEKKICVATPIKSNFLTREEEEENHIIHSRDIEQQEKQQEELLAFQNQIFLSQTNHTTLNTSNLTNIGLGGTNASIPSVLMRNSTQTRTPPSRNVLLSNVSPSKDLDNDTPMIGTREYSQQTPISKQLTSPKDLTSPRHQVTSPLFDSVDLQDENNSLPFEKLSSFENNVESLKLMKRRHRENYLPETFLHFCKHETSKIYGWSLESEKYSVQFYIKSISLHSLATGDFSAISRLQNIVENTSTQDLSKNLRFKQTPIINDSVNYIIANRFVGILSETNFRDAYLACKDIYLRKETKQMEEVVVLESYYNVEGPEITYSRKPKVPDECFDIIYQRTSSPNTLFGKYLSFFILLDQKSIVSKREYLSARYFIEENDRLIILERSIDKVLPVPHMLQTLTLEYDKKLNEVKNNPTNPNSNSLVETTTTSSQTNNLQNDFLSPSSSPSRQRSKSVGISSKSLTEIHTTPLTARSTSTHILQQSAPTLSSPNDRLKTTLSSPQKGVVRANILFQILIFDRLSDTETKFQIINNVDVKGWLKSWNSLTQKNNPHKIFEDFVAVIEEYKNKHNNI